MILIDECVTKRLEDYLKKQGLKEPIITVSQHYPGASDDWLYSYAKGAEEALKTPTTLITKDYQFYHRYNNHKILKQGRGFKSILKELKRIGY